MKIVFLDSGTVDFEDINVSSIENLGQYYAYPFTSVEQVPERIKEADVIIANKFPINATTMAGASNLKSVMVAATGYNNLDIGFLSSKNIMACNVRNYSTTGVAQHVFSLLLNHRNKVQYYIDEVKKGRWHKSIDFCFYDHSLQELYSQSIGIIGFGNIGKQVANIAHSFGMKVLVYTSYPVPAEYSFANKISLQQTFMEADVLSLHCPYNDDTRHIINKESLSLMKSDATLINTGRGALIDEIALFQHLQLNPKFNALLDVLTTEPPQSQPLIELNNCLITPHIAWASQASRQRLIDGIAENIAAFIDGKPINRVI